MKRFTDTEVAKYDLPSLPPFVNFVLKSGDDCSQKPTEIKWGSLSAPPAIGQRVHINFNGLRDGTVESYFHEHGWLGVCVKIDKIPKWKMKQETNRDCALVFAVEIENIPTLDTK